MKLFAELPDDDIGDSREERAFRMWINSLGLPDTTITNLFEYVRDGLLLLRTMDHVRPEVVSWRRVNMAPRMVFKKVENTNYVTCSRSWAHSGVEGERGSATRKSYNGQMIAWRVASLRSPRIGPEVVACL